MMRPTRPVIGQEVPAQYVVLVTRRDEGRQVELLGRFAAEGAFVQGAAVVGEGGSTGAFFVAERPGGG